MTCPGGDAWCDERGRWCLCGVLACPTHGHVAYGNDFYCPYLNLGQPEEEVSPPPRVIHTIDLSA